MSEAPDRSAARINVALTKPAEEAAEELTTRLRLPHRVDTVRLGVAHALRTGMSLDRPDDFGSTSGTNYNVGTVDPGGELKDLLLALRPDITGDPYRVIETLMSVGTLALKAQVDAGEFFSLKDIITGPVTSTQEES